MGLETFDKLELDLNGVSYYAPTSIKISTRFPFNDSLVYLLHAPELDRFKIGYAKDLYNRIRGIRNGSPTPIFLLNFYPGAKREEKKLHGEFSLYRVYSEWFKADESISQHFERRAAEVICNQKEFVAKYRADQHALMDATYDSPTSGGAL